MCLEGSVWGEAKERQIINTYRVVRACKIYHKQSFLFVVIYSFSTIVYVIAILKSIISCDCSVREHRSIFGLSEGGDLHLMPHAPCFCHNINCWVHHYNYVTGPKKTSIIYIKLIYSYYGTYLFSVCAIQFL